MRINTAPALALGLAVVITAACSRRERMEAGSSESQSKAPAPTLSVKDVDLGRTINADKTVADKTDDFKPKETVYVSVATVGTKDGTLKAVWTGPDGKVVDETTEHVSPKGPEHTEFHIVKPAGLSLGHYRVDVYLNANVVGSKEFDVKRK